MSLTFDDTQLESISLEYVNMPASIIQLGIDKAKIIALRSSILIKDNENAKFTDHYEGVIVAYHDELELLDGLTKTNYIHSQIDDGGAKVIDTPHFPNPTEIWTKLQPKITDCNTGLPTSSFSSLYETAAIEDVITKRDQVLNGFNDGSGDTTSTEAYSGTGTLEVDSLTGFNNGDRVVIDLGGVSAIAEVTGSTPAGGSCSDPIYTDQSTCETNGEVWTPSDASLTLTHISGSTSIGIGARVKNSRPTYTNAEREGTSTPYDPEVLTYFKGLLDADVVLWEGVLGNILTALNSNDSIKESSEITTAKTNVGDCTTDIDTWEAYPATGSGVGRYGDTRLATLNSTITDRDSEVTARVTQITTALGTCTQIADGTFSGNGAYFDLFNWIDLRLNIAGGTLSTWYAMALQIEFFDIQIVMTETKEDEYEDSFRIEPLSVDADGTNTVTLADASGYSVSDTVKVFAVGESVITTTISSIVGGDITLGTAVSIGYTMAKKARLLREL